MKKRILFVLCIILLICFVPKVEKCKCGGTVIQSLIYKIEKVNIDLRGEYVYYVDIFGINVYGSDDEIK